MKTNPQQVRVWLVGAKPDIQPCVRLWRHVPAVEVCDTPAVRSTALRGGSGRGPFLRALDALLAAGSVDILHFCTPGIHADLVRAGVERGCDVLLTPPLEWPERIIAGIDRLARKCNIRVWPLHYWRFLPGAARLAEFTALGALGELKLCELRCPPAPGLWARLLPGAFAAERMHRLDAWGWSDFCNWVVGPPESPGGAPPVGGQRSGNGLFPGSRLRIRAVTAPPNELEFTLHGDNGTVRYQLRIAADAAGEIREQLTADLFERTRNIRVPKAEPLTTAFAYAAGARREGGPCVHLSLADVRNVLNVISRIAPHCRPEDFRNGP